jgi:tRNA A37 N6-isopentenylltransferase MiaA
MNLGNFKKYKWLIILALLVLAGVFSFFYRFYHKDIKALADFSSSYEKFDKAISDYFIGETDDLESKADKALIELHTKAVAFRLSSLIKNDAELMNKALEIADFSGRELGSLRAHKRAIQSQNADLDALAKEHGDLTGKRKTAYARFQELAGFKD